ncbi:NifU family protein [Promicromonospora panici]|uniref:NifU family protein n=1 Tax=Promicromonospora panici TaxID=2219658 RepID=UPI00101D4F9E|nr:NifU family protein [Promicromonospora panici]
MAADPRELSEALRAIRPRLRGHAGDMDVQVDEQGDVVVRFLGACESCPAMAVTYAGLVQTVLESVSGVHGVRAPQVHASPEVLAGIRRRLGVRAPRPATTTLGMPRLRESAAPD